MSVHGHFRQSPSFCRQGGPTPPLPQVGAGRLYCVFARAGWEAGVWGPGSLLTVCVWGTSAVLLWVRSPWGKGPGLVGLASPAPPALPTGCVF